MLSFGQSKRVANLVIDDYVIRLVENNGKGLASIKIAAEKVLPQGMIQNGKIIDELQFYEFMKEVVQAWGIKNRSVRFYVPHALIIMRDIELPEKMTKDEIRQYITMEIGNTIHFPFKNPVFDLLNAPETESVDKVTVLAAPEEEMMKYTEILADVKLKPTVVDVQALGTYRFFMKKHKEVTKDKVYLMLELNLTSVNISIFHQNHLEFLRYQPLNVSINHWQSSGEEEQIIRWHYTGDLTKLHGEIDDQLNEIERLMNFYQFSIRNGEHSVTDLILLGDYPDLADIERRLDHLYNLPISTLTAGHIGEHQLGPAFVPALGLALRGDNSYD